MVSRISEPSTVCGYMIYVVICFWNEHVTPWVPCIQIYKELADVTRSNSLFVKNLSMVNLQGAIVKKKKRSKTTGWGVLDDTKGMQFGMNFYHMTANTLL